MPKSSHGCGHKEKTALSQRTLAVFKKSVSACHCNHVVLGIPKDAVISCISDNFVASLILKRFAKPKFWMYCTS